MKNKGLVQKRENQEMLTVFKSVKQIQVHTGIKRVSESPKKCNFIHLFFNMYVNPRFLQVCDESKVFQAVNLIIFVSFTASISFQGLWLQGTSSNIFCSGAWGP